MKGKIFIMSVAVVLVYGCRSNDLLGKYDTRNCNLVANASNRVTQLTFWVDSGNRTIVYIPKQRFDSINLCQLISDTLKLQPSDVVLISATFVNGNKKDSAQGEFHLERDNHSIMEIKQSIQ